MILSSSSSDAVPAPCRCGRRVQAKGTVDVGQMKHAADQKQAKRQGKRPDYSGGPMAALGDPGGPFGTKELIRLLCVTLLIASLLLAMQSSSAELATAARSVLLSFLTALAFSGGRRT